MIVLEEGKLRFEFSDASHGYTFDETESSKPTYHGLSHCMKAVDFYVEFEDKYLFVEVKDPPIPTGASRSARYDAAEDYNKLLNSLVHKFRDSFLYHWAEKKKVKPISYLCLINLDSALTLKLLNDLKRQLPESGPMNGRWSRDLVKGCAVANMSDWNAAFPNWQIARLP